MHRAAYHFIKALGIPSLTKRKRKRGADADDDEVANDSGAENEDDDEADVDVSMDIEADADDADAMAETMVVDFELGDTIGKLLAFVNQVRVSSEGVREYLAHCCRLQEVKPIELLLWVRSRWGSLSHCLGTVLVVQKVSSSIVSVTTHTNGDNKPIDYFCLTADSNEKLPPLQKKLWSDYKLSPSEWKLVRLVHNCLKVGGSIVYCYSELLTKLC
jgi:hypothetical protein